MTWLYDNQVSWRLPIAMQIFWATVTLALVPLMVESPRWLCFKDRHDEAQIVLARLSAKDPEDIEVKIDLRLISEAIKAQQADGPITWKECLSGGERQNFRRIVLGAVTSIFQQMGGVNVVSATVVEVRGPADTSTGRLLLPRYFERLFRVQ